MDQQRGETDAKDSALVKEHVERLKADQEKDTLTTELINSRADLANAESALMSRKAECRRLQELLASADEVNIFSNFFFFFLGAHVVRERACAWC